MKTLTLIRPCPVACIQLKEFVRFFRDFHIQATYSDVQNFRFKVFGLKVSIPWRVRYLAIVRYEVFTGRVVVVWRNPTCPDHVDYCLAAIRLSDILSGLNINKE